jgi:hypothetical protein
MVPIKGDWIYTGYDGFISEGTFDHYNGDINGTKTRIYGSYAIGLAEYYYNSE